VATDMVARQYCARLTEWAGGPEAACDSPVIVRADASAGGQFASGCVDEAAAVM
jgi:hypothetical protein